MNTVDKNPSNYYQFLSEIVTLVQQCRVIAVQMVQNHSNQLYWSIGEQILKRQKEYGWGKSIVERLSADLKTQIGDGVSWSPRNLWLMRQLVSEYSNLNQLDSDLKTASVTGEILNQADSEIEKVKQLVSKVPWQHNVLIIQKVKDYRARLFYLQSTVKNHYSRSVLLHQIKADAYSHFLKHPAQHNFQAALPEHLLEQTRETIKSVYSLDFLEINQPITERQLERVMVAKVKRLMMELGYGFCFIGDEYRLELGNKEYFIDLLFYHRILKCLVAVELKVNEFEPEYVGKLDFYLQLVDEQLKQPDDQPSIGILLVPHKEQLEVEYALRIASKPIGIAQYTLSRQLPAELAGKLPSANDFQQLLIPKTNKK